MAGETGVNEGVGGPGASGLLISIDGVGALFAVAFDDYGLALAATVLDITGRGDTAGDKTYRLEDAHGSFSGTGRVKGDKRPLPKYLATATGLVRVVQAAAADRDGGTVPQNYEQFAAVFSSIQLQHAPADLGGEDVWTVRFTATKNGPITQGWLTLDGTAEEALSPLPTALVKKELFAGLTKVIDPQGLRTSARQVHDMKGIANNDTAESAALLSVIGSAATPLTNAKLVTAVMTRTGGIGGRAMLSYELMDAADQIIQGGQYSTRSALEPYTAVLLTILDSTSSAESIAVSQWASFQSEDNAYRLKVSKLNLQKALVVKEYVNPGLGVVSDIFALPEYQIGRVNSGEVQVYVGRIYPRSDSINVLELRRSHKRRSARRFTLSRLLKGTVAPDFQSIFEDTNNATFFGLPAGSVLYESGRMRTNIGLSGTYPFYMDYQFLWAEEGHYAIDGWNGVVHTSASPALGWNDVDTLTGSGLAASTPTQSDFSVFLA